MKFVACVAVLTAGLVLSLESSAKAQAPVGILAGCGNSGFHGFYYNDNGLNQRLPYFALHPPVYYSYPVPRSYGYSPFAYPASVMTPEVELTGKLEIINPHVAPKPEAKEAKLDQVTSIPAVMINPYVEQPTAGAAQLTSF